VGGRGGDRIGRLLDEVAGELWAVAGLVTGQADRDEVTSLAKSLSGPVQIAIGGRLKAGKSTLVNAFVGRRVAATAAGECTKVVSSFRYGDRDRGEVFARDGRSWPVFLAGDGSWPEDLGAPAAEIERVEVSVTVRSIGDRVYVDTPGLFSLNDEFSEGSRRLFGLDDGSKSAVRNADALVYLMPHPADADREFLESFHRLYPDSELSAATVVGVLSRIDLLCRRPGLDDPWPDARRVAANAANNKQLRRSLRTVVPVAGLLAETSLGGSLTERDVQSMARLAAATERERMLASVDAFRSVGVVDADEVGERSRLLDLLGLYGLAVSFRLVDQGADRVADLLPALRDASGIDALVDVLGDVVSVRVPVCAAWSALDSVEALSYRVSEPSVADELRAVVERLRLRSEFRAIDEMRVLRELDAGQIRLGPDRERELLAIARFTRLRERLSLGPNTSGPEARQHALELWQSWRGLENDDRESASVRRAAGVIRASVEAMLDQIEDSLGTGTFATTWASN
jgi:hypothetical protein